MAKSCTGGIEIKTVLKLVLMVSLLINSAIFSLALQDIAINAHKDTHVLGTESIYQDDASHQRSVPEDKNRNNVDDIIEAYTQSGETERMLDIFVHYDNYPTPENVAFLQHYTDVTDLYSNVNIIAAANASIYNIKNYIVNLPGVSKIEWQGSGAQCGLDISAKAVKAKPSALYSPYTAWESGFTGKDMHIAILDTGVDNEHESLTGKFVAGYNAFTDVVTDPDDDHGHGTHVAGIAMGSGGTHPEYKGAAPDAKLVDVKVLDSTGRGPSNIIIRGIDWCINNRDIYNISVLSMSIYVRNANSDGSDAMSQAVNRAVDAGIVAVVCVGNTPGRFIGPIAAADNAITVGAIYDEDTVDRSDDYIWWSSSIGPRDDDGDSDLFDELKPDLVAPGVSIIAPQGDSTSGYVSMTGTSMATPHVAGVAALILERKPSLTPGQVKEYLHLTAEDKDGIYNPVLDPKYDTVYGWGELDAFNAVSVCEVTFLTDPSGLNFNITFEDRTYHNGDTDTFLYNTSGLATTNAPEGCIFTRWETTGSVLAVNPNVSTTTVVVSFDGTIEAYWICESETKLYLDPHEVDGPPPNIGDAFELTLRVNTVENLYAWTVNVSWDPLILEHVGASEGDCLKSNGTTLFLMGAITPGRIEGMMCTLLGDPSTHYLDVPPAPNDLAAMAFQVLDYAYEIGTWVNITYSQLLDNGAEEIAHTVANTSITIYPPDLHVTDVILPFTHPMLYANITYSIEVAVANLGTGVASAFNISLDLFWERENEKDYCEQQLVPGLAPGATTTMYFQVRIANAALGFDYRLNATVDCDNDVVESDEANNHMDIDVDGRIPGDLDGNGIVDFDDIIVIAMAYDSEPGDSNWNELADLDADGDVDFDNVIWAAMHYGKSCTA